MSFPRSPFCRLGAALLGLGALSALQGADQLAPAAVPGVGVPAPVLDGPGLGLAPAGRSSPSQNVTINLINRLVQKGVLTKEDASELIRQAEQDAVVARAQATQDAAAAAREAAGPALTEDTVRVPYIPEVVKAQMREQIKEEVLAEARDERWAAPRTLPLWTTRVRLFGDVRVRYEGLNFPDGNDNTGAFPNFNAINTGSPFDTSGTIFSPQYDVDQRRERFRLRARVGLEADIGEGFSLGLRIGTGETNTPVTQNQTIGFANQGQGGNFSKYAVWLDRAYLKYELGAEGKNRVSLTLGRFDNPFFSPTAMIWADEIGFDGAVIQGQYEVVHNVTPFLVGGAFPVFNTDLNFATNNPAKFHSEDKYLYAGQIGLTWKITPDLTFKAAGAYFHFQNIEGKLSDPFTPLTSSDAGNTDDSRPSFAQTGNTYMALRDIVPNANNNFGTINQFQYFGLAAKFHELVLNGKLDYTRFEPFVISLSGEYAKNLAFDRNDIESKAVNNRGADTALGAAGAFTGGDTAWIVNLKVGSAALAKRWDWNAYVNYRYVESDAVVDAFADADFGGTLLGTNHKGYTVGGNLSLSSNVWLGVRWMSSTEIAGPPFKNDLIQIDINGKF